MLGDGPNAERSPHKEGKRKNWAGVEPVPPRGQGPAPLCHRVGSHSMHAHSQWVCLDRPLPVGAFQGAGDTWRKPGCGREVGDKPTHTPACNEGVKMILRGN